MRPWLALAAAVMFALAATAILAVAAASPVAGGIGNCGQVGKCPTSIPPPSLSASVPISTASATPVPSPTAAPTATGPTPSPYSFDDEFSGTSIDPVWIRHFSCCGTLAGYDPSLATVSGGYLHLSVVQRSTGFWGYLLDTKTTFTQRFGYFEARMQIPKGAGLWPAFWSYYSGSDEIDAMEVCANPLGANGGNDASLLHTTVHISSGALGHATRTADLSLAFHTYGVDWRSDHATFYLDGAAVWTDTGTVPQIALPLIVNLGAGGRWCGTAAAGGTLLVDYVRARP